MPMWRMLALAAAISFAAPQAATKDQLSQAERDAAVKILNETRAKFLASIDGVSDAQWTYKPGPGRWWIAEVSEPIGISETTFLHLATNQIVKSPKVPADVARPADAKVIDSVTDRTEKFQAPEMLRPTNRWASRDALTKDFETA